MEQTDQASGQTQQTSGEALEDKVSYESFQKVLGEKKKTQARLAENQQELEAIKEQLEAMNQDKLQAEGKKDELIKSLQSKVQELSGQVKEKDSQYGWTLVQSKLKEEALKQGCKRADVFMNLLVAEKDELATVRVGENFEVDSESVKSLVERAKEKYQDIGLFGQPTPAVHDAVPNSEKPKKDLSQMSTNELKNMYKNLMS